MRILFIYLPLQQKRLNNNQDEISKNNAFAGWVGVDSFTSRS